MKPAVESFIHLLNYDEEPLPANTILKPQLAPLLRGRAQLAMCFNQPGKPALPEADLPVNTLQPDMLAAGYQSLFRSPAFPWN